MATLLSEVYVGYIYLQVAHSCYIAMAGYATKILPVDQHLEKRGKQFKQNPSPVASSLKSRSLIINNHQYYT